MNFDPIFIPAILIAITFHEYAHGWTADKLGDPTARYAGRLTFNPISHIDLFGTLMLFLVGFGWAKPVPVNPMYLRNPKKDLIYVSLAGPVSNLLIALIFAQTFAIIGIENLAHIFGFWTEGMFRLIVYTIKINIVLAWFNLIPIPPLDGSKILAGFLPPKYDSIVHMLEHYGPFIFIGIILFSQITHFPILGMIINPLIYLTMRIMMGSELSTQLGL